MEEDTEGQTEETPPIQQQDQKRHALAGAATIQPFFKMSGRLRGHLLQEGASTRTTGLPY